MTTEEEKAWGDSNRQGMREKREDSGEPITTFWGKSIPITATRRRKLESRSGEKAVAMVGN